MNLVELLFKSVKEHSARECICFKRSGEYQAVTYGELWETILQLRSGLSALGVKAGDKVAILSGNCPEWVVCDFALLALGAVVVPVYPTLADGQVAYILQNSDVSFVFVEDARQLDKIKNYGTEQLKHIILLHDDVTTTDGRISSYTRVLTSGHLEESVDLGMIPEDQLATIVHTAGTSGTPRGVMLSHKNLVSNVQASLSVFPIQVTDITLSYLPLSHIFARTVEEFAMLFTGATVAYAEGIDTIQEDLKQVRPTIFVTVPRLLEKVYTRIDTRLAKSPPVIRSIVRRDLTNPHRSGLASRVADWLVYRKVRQGFGGRVRFIVSGGAGLSVDIARFYNRAGIPIFEGYGMTEAAPVITVNTIEAHRPGTVGIPIPGVEVRLAEDGELLVRGPNVMLGYYKDPAETSLTMTSDGWLRTGDIAAIDTDGYVKIVERKKNILVLSTGKNVAPSPIEKAIALSAFIAAAILVGDGRKYVTCLISPDYQAIRSLVERLGLSDNPDTWIHDASFRHFIAAEIATAVQGFAPFEQPKRAALLPAELTVEEGDLTPKLEVRTKFVRAKYAHIIESMYKGNDYIPIEWEQQTPAPE